MGRGSPRRGGTGRLLLPFLALLLLAPAVAMAEGGALGEGWALRRGDDPGWEQAATSAAGWAPVTLPATWGQLGLEGEDGIFWLRRGVELDAAQRRLAAQGRLAIALGAPRYGAYELWAGRRRVGRSPGAENRLPVPREAVFRLPAEALGPGGELELGLRVRRVGWASDPRPDGGPVGARLEIGDHELLHDRVEGAAQRLLLDEVPMLLAVVVFAVAALYFGLLFSRRRRSEHAYLWFSLLAASFALNAYTTTYWAFELTSRLDLVLRLSDLSGHLAAALSIQFLWPFLGQRISRPWRLYQLSHLGFALLLAGWPDPRLVIDSNALRWWWLVPLLVGALRLIVVEAWRGRREARILAAGAAVLVGAEAHELVSSLYLPALRLPMSLVPLGFTAVLVSMAVSLSNRFQRLYDELEQLRRSLEHRVRERTRALEEAKEEALATSRLKSEFLANVSHEIRTPMNSVLGMTGLLLDSRMSADQRDWLETLRSSGEALLTQINDLLDFAKIESGTLEVGRRPFDVRAAIEDSLDVIAPLAAPRRLEMTYAMADGTPEMVVGDPSRTRQILVNLLSNAVKFTPRGEIHVDLTARSFAEGSVELHFSVADTGIGITPEKLAVLFDAFRQADGSPTRRYGGTGLGLAISRRLSELLGGRIWAESRSEGGSVFHFTVVGEVAPGVTSSRTPVEDPILAGKRLLIAEGHPRTRSLLVELTRGWHMEVEAVATAGEAVTRLATAGGFDVALLEQALPDRSGEEVAAAMRALTGTGRPTPCVLLHSVEEGGGEPPGRASVAAALAKPVKPRELEKILAGLLDPEAPPAAVGHAVFERDLAKRHPLRLLVAEDDRVNRKVLLQILRRFGYRADGVVNGLEVLQSLERQTYDLVFMDLQMPEMDGFEATHQIRQRIDAACRPRLVAVTAHAMPGDRERCLAAGMDDYVSKPVEVAEIRDALLAASRRRQAQRSRPNGEPAAARSSGGPPAAAPAAAAPSTETQVGEAVELLDRRRLELLRDLESRSGEAVVLPLVRSFVDSSGTDIVALRAAAADGCWGDLKHVAHRLKGRSANLGARRVAALCLELERRAGGGSGGDPVEGLIEQLNAELGRAIDALERNTGSVELPPRAS